MKNLFRNYSAAIAIVFLAIIGGVALWADGRNSTQQLYESQIAACERGNVLRTESNHRIPAHTTEKKVLIKFLSAARMARLKAGTPVDIRTAQEYLSLQNELRSRVNFDPVTVVDCYKVVAKP